MTQLRTHDHSRALHLIVITALLALTWLALSPGSHASFAVSTLDVDMFVPAGQTHTSSFRVTNTGTTVENITIDLLDWRRDPTGQHSFYAPGSIEGSLAEWLDYAPRTVRLEPGESAEISVTVAVPNGERGSRWAIFMVDSEVRPFDSTQGGFGLQVRTRYGVKVMQTVPGTEDIQGRVTRLSVAQGSVERPAVLSLEFWNTGNVQVRPSGYFEVRSRTGQTLWRQTFSEAPVLPDGRVLFSTPYTGDLLAAGQYVVLGVVNFGGPNLVAAQAIWNIASE